MKIKKIYILVIKMQIMINIKIQKPVFIKSQLKHKILRLEIEVNSPEIMKNEQNLVKKLVYMDKHFYCFNVQR